MAEFDNVLDDAWLRLKFNVSRSSLCAHDLPQIQSYLGMDDTVLTVELGITGRTLRRWRSEPLKPLPGPARALIHAWVLLKKNHLDYGSFVDLENFLRDRRLETQYG